eukprot:TRINITY_DN2706_c0_g1_i1.p1 TRINITY_DN2706_c0_g1~~TRINITY_DN2706_c0_g1_i1.p1  ORF type:complete len:220 (+),score=77.58 TRINITY_DN2706_c0_g1_i1:37-696(+)
MSENNNNNQDNTIEISKICVYCGSRVGSNPNFEIKTKELAEEMCKRNIDLVYGGGTVGLMGVIARGIIENNGTVTGVIPKSLLNRETSGDNIGEVIEVVSMHERKKKMSSLADAFIALPGGLGTFEELFEILTWIKLGVFDKRTVCGILNVDHYFDPFVNLVDNAIENGFVSPENRNVFVIDDDPVELLNKMKNPPIIKPLVEKWIKHSDNEEDELDVI